MVKFQSKNIFLLEIGLKNQKKNLYLFKKKKIPIIVGGTGLYFNTITKGISKIPRY